MLAAPACCFCELPWLAEALILCRGHWRQAEVRSSVCELLRQKMANAMEVSLCQMHDLFTERHVQLVACAFDANTEALGIASTDDSLLLMEALLQKEIVLASMFGA